jgi:hypothetical protein
MPAFSRTRRQLAISASTCARISSGVDVRGMAPTSMICLRTVFAAKHLMQRLVHLVDDGLRRAGREGEPVPARHLIVLQTGFGDRRHVGQYRIALLRGDGDRPEIAGADLAEHRLDEFERSVVADVFGGYRIGKR